MSNYIVKLIVLLFLIAKEKTMNYILGLDIGITSIGYAIMRLDENNNPDKIVFLDSIIFPIAENEKGKSYASKRGELRRVRRIGRRRKFRKHRIKSLFTSNHMLTKNEISESLNSPSSVYELRVKGLDQKLSNSELFKILYWFGGHRGFKSNRKAELKEKDMGKLLHSLNNTKEELNNSNYRTIGELYLKSPIFKDHKRNKFYDDGYIGATYRTLIVDEAKKILEFQSTINSQVDDNFIKNYLDILQSQRDFDEGPGSNSPYAGNQIEKMIGHDSLVPDRVRGSKASFTFNYFDMLSKINEIKIKNNIYDNFHSLTKEQRNIVIKKALSNKKTKFNQIKKYLKLPDDAQFNLVRYEKKNAESTTTLCDFTPVREIKDCLPKNKKENNELIDDIATILSTYKSDKTRTQHLIDKLDKDTINKLLSLNYSKFGHLSIETMREITPYLEDGDLYNDAALKAGYDFQNVKINDEYIDNNVTNAVVKRSVRKTIKLVKKITKKFGNPYEIHIELARELGKSQKERHDIEKNQLNNQSKNEAIANQIKELGFPVNGQNILKMKLYKEQQCIDFYSKNSNVIDISKALSGDDYYEIDHIIPYSISFDDSYSNKILVSKKANQEKGNRIPMQYLGNDSESVEWLTINANKLSNLKKRNFLLKKELTADDTKGWKDRNIHDTSYMNKLLANYLKQNVIFNKEDNKKHVYTLNGSVTAKIRNRWGITKNREASDIHHAIDAVVIACVTDSFVQKVTRYSKNKEIKYNSSLWSNNEKSNIHTNSTFKAFFNDFPLPYPKFREELTARTSENPKEMMKGKDWNNKYTNEEINKLKPITVVRLPQKKISGEIHKETLNSAKKLNDGIISRRVTVDKLKVKNGRICYSQYEYKLHEDGGNKYVWNILYNKLCQRDEMESEKKNADKEAREIINQKVNDLFPNNALVFERNGHKNEIRKFKVEKNSTSGVILNNGNSIADNAKGSMIRVDVFANDKNYLLVPVYRGDIHVNKLPTKAISRSSKDYNISKKDKFVFSIYKNDLIYIKFNQPRKIQNTNLQISEMLGYFVSCDSSSGSIHVMSTDNSFEFKKIGVSTLPMIQKYQIDYFGNYHLVHEKKRQRFNN